MVDRRRLFRAQFQDISVIECSYSGIYRVSGSEDAIYTVSVTEPSCTCPDWNKRRPSGGCKHDLAVKLEKEEIEPLDAVDINPPQRGNQNSDLPENWTRLRESTLERDNWECQVCGIDISSRSETNAHVHHIEPRSRGGTDELYNLISLCHSCHESLHGFAINPESDGRDSEKTEQNIIRRGGGEEPDDVTKDSSRSDHFERTAVDEYCMEAHPHRYWHFIACSEL